MTTKIRATLLTAIFFFGLLTSLQAQDKYDFATIVWSPLTSRLAISLNGKEFTDDKVELPKNEYSYANSNPLLTKLNEFQDKGWGVMSIIPVSSNALSHYVYLRKKKS